MGRSRKRRRLWLRLGLIVVAMLAAIAAHQWLTWPNVAALATTNPTTSAFIEGYKRAEARAGRTPQVAWTWVPYARISPHLKRGGRGGEHINFFSPAGVALPAATAGARGAPRAGAARRGASTITQQLAKNLWLSPSRNPWRKVKEAMLTRQLEQHLDKRRILELYLNLIELGPGVYGAEAGARRYFKRSAADLNERQAAQLGASLPRPTSWNPKSTSKVYRQRVERTIGRMQRAKWLWDVI